MKNVSVFCGSKLGNVESFAKQAQLVGELLAKKDKTLIYGGAKVGLMGELANACLRSNGNVIGVIPRFLEDLEEKAHEELTEIKRVDTMAERKNLMFDLSDAILLLPGGPGSLDEFFEALTLRRLSVHEFNLYIFNHLGIYDSLIIQLEKMIEHGFLDQKSLDMINICENMDELTKAFSQVRYKAPKGQYGFLAILKNTEGKHVVLDSMN